MDIPTVEIPNGCDGTLTVSPYASFTVTTITISIGITTIAITIGSHVAIWIADYITTAIAIALDVKVCCDRRSD
jgi:hypothetical protein